MPSSFHIIVLALAYATNVLSHPGYKISIKGPASVLAEPTVTPHPAGGFKKRQDANDIVATYGTGSVLSKMYPAQMANNTATNGPNPYCTAAQNPELGLSATCECVGANPPTVPTNQVSGWECAYTVVPGTLSASTTAAPASTQAPSPCVETDYSGVVWQYASRATELVPGGNGETYTECAGSSSAVSTVASLAAQASDAAFFDNGYCGWQSEDSFYVAFGVLIPNWQSTFDFDTANNDFRGSLDGNSACSGFSHYQGVYGGPQNTTFAAAFWVSDFCTAWQMTQVIKATTGNAFNIPCNEYDGLEIHPDSPEVAPGESEPEEIEIEKRDAILSGLLKRMI